MASKLPVFVYGTLRPGQSNYSHYLGNEKVQDFFVGSVRGFELVSRGAFPMALRGTRDDEVVHGNLLVIRPELYDKVMAALDGLEGYQPGRNNNHFERTVVNVEYKDSKGQLRETPAYMYCCPDGYENTYRFWGVIPSGDWVAYRGTSTFNTMEYGYE